MTERFVTRSMKEAWQDLASAYLRGRPTLKRVCLLIDARHGLKEADQPALNALSEAAVSHQIVLTKADQVKRAELSARITEIQALLEKRPAAFPKVLTTSTRDGTGIPELRAAIARLLAERHG